jgi:Tol biopolymer transport system component
MSRGGPQFWGFSPAWSPESKSIYYTERDATGPARPLLMSLGSERPNAEKGTRRAVTPPPVESPQVSADGLWFLFEGMGPSANRDIFVSTLMGELRTRITNYSGMDFDPVWRPASQR